MLTIITVTYNSRREIERFLLSLSDMLRTCSMEAETKIWDNASTDGTGEYLQSSQTTLPVARISLNRSPKNVGLSKAVNSEIASCNGQWVLLCNPDVEFSNEVSKILEYASSHPEYGVVPVRPKDQYTDGSPVSQGFFLSTRLSGGIRLVSSHSSETTTSILMQDSHAPASLSSLAEPFCSSTEIHSTFCRGMEDCLMRDSPYSGMTLTCPCGPGLKGSNS